MPSRILLVDDDPDVSYLLQLLLEQTGRYEVKLQTQAREALATVTAFRPDLVLLDVTMPIKNGYEIANEIAAEPSLGNPVVVFLTGLDVEEEKKKRPGSHFLGKPFRTAELVSAVDGFLAGRATA